MRWLPGSRVTTAAGLPATVATAASVDDILQQVQRLADQQRADHAALQAIFARSPDAFVSFGPDGRVAYLSPPFETLTGLPPEAAMGCDALGLLALLGGDGQADARRGWGGLCCNRISFLVI